MLMDTGSLLGGPREDRGGGADFSFAGRQHQDALSVAGSSGLNGTLRSRHRIRTLINADPCTALHLVAHLSPVG